MATALACAVPGATPPWPPFLPDRAAVAEDAAIEATWAEPTFERRVTAPRLDVPRALYVALIDSPDILAAAARHLGLTDESATALGDGSYALRSPGGSQAIYRVILDEADRRVTWSHGTHAALGTHVAATVLGDLRLGDGGDGGDIEPHLDVWVRLDNRVVAWFARALQWALPAIADRELLRGFRLAAGVATWAARDRDSFCRWIAGEDFAASRAAAIEGAAGCPPRKG